MSQDVFRFRGQTLARCDAPSSSALSNGFSASTEEIIDVWAGANSGCRGGSGDDPHTILDQASTPVQEHGKTRGKPAELSRTDPAAAWSARVVRGRFGYAFNILIDTPGGAAMEVEASPSRFAAEVDAGRNMLARAGERFSYHPKRVAADTAYGSAGFLVFVHRQGAVPHIPVLERSKQVKSMFPRERFTFNREGNFYICPNGKVLLHRGFEQQIGVHSYKARVEDCKACLLQKNAPPDKTAACIAWRTRTPATWCAGKCRPPYLNARCDSAEAWSACSPTRSQSED